MGAFHKDIQYALGKLGKSKFGFERTVVSKFKGKGHVGSGNELVDYSRAPCLGADQRHVGSGIEITLRLLCTFRGVSRASDVARPV